MRQLNTCLKKHHYTVAKYKTFHSPKQVPTETNDRVLSSIKTNITFEVSVRIWLLVIWRSSSRGSFIYISIRSRHFVLSVAMLSRDNVIGNWNWRVGFWQRTQRTGPDFQSTAIMVSKKKWIFARFFRFWSVNPSCWGHSGLKLYYW